MPAHRVLRPRPRLARELTAMLLFKLLALILLYALCFGPDHRPRIDPERLFSPAYPAPSPATMR